MIVAKSTSPNSSKPSTIVSLLMAALISVAVMASFCLSGCGKKADPAASETTEDTRHTESIAQVGEVPSAFEEIIADDRFKNVYAFSDRLMEVKSVLSKDGKSKKNAVIMMDL